MTTSLLKSQYTRTANNTDHLVNLFNNYYPYKGIERLVYKTDTFVIMVVLYGNSHFESGIYASFDVNTDIDLIDDWDYESILKKEYLLDCIDYCEN